MGPGIPGRIRSGASAKTSDRMDGLAPSVVENSDIIHGDLLDKVLAERQLQVASAILVVFRVAGYSKDPRGVDAWHRSVSGRKLPRPADTDPPATEYSSRRDRETASLQS